jgi:CheY-like chemotaxis protein
MVDYVSTVMEMVKADDLAGKRIFVVEDDVTNMAIIAVLLRQKGAVVFQDAWNSVSVDMLVQHLPVDLIILDLMLRRNISGYDIFARIRLDPRLHHIPVIISTAADPGIEVPRARALGVTGFIGKPIIPSQFANQVLACLNGTEVWTWRGDLAFPEM